VYVIHIKFCQAVLYYCLYSFFGVQSYGDTYDATAITGACEGIGGGSVRSLNWVKLLPGMSVCLIFGPHNVIVVLGFKLLPKYLLTDPFNPPVPRVCMVQDMRLHTILIEENLFFCHITED